MGLDMYLTGKIYLWGSDEGKDAKIKKQIAKMFPNIPHRANEISFEIMYWRKANAIHKWFVDNIQNGDDDCGNYYVEHKQLKLLRDTIKEGLIDKNRVALKLNKDALSGSCNGLPTTGGFFFGGTEYDEYYWKELERTLKMLNKIFDNPKMYDTIDFEYHSSW